MHGKASFCYIKTFCEGTKGIERMRFSTHRLFRLRWSGSARTGIVVVTRAHLSWSALLGITLSTFYFAVEVI